MNLNDGILHNGNYTAIRQCMERAASGEPITVGFLGGSITQGSLSSTPETCYAYLVYRWWQDTFPASKITHINAGIGGTTSQFGVARVEEDLLQYSPDFVLTEFSVNDDNTFHFQQTYEGLIRRILRDCPALLLMHNVCYDTGYNAQDMHLPVAQHYDLPCVSMRTTIYAALQAGEMQNRDITPDDLHPNDAGHALVASVVIHLLEQIWNFGKTDRPSQALPAPLTANLYENSKRFQNHNSCPELLGFIRDDTPMHHITECFRRGFTAWKKDDQIKFLVTGSCISVQYRKSVNKPTPIAQVIVDGDSENAVILDGNFQETWGDCLYLQTVAEGLQNTQHEVLIRVVEDHADDVVPFYLVSVIASGGEMNV